MRILTVLALLACLCACGGPEPAKTLDVSKELRPHIDKLFAGWETLDPAKVAPFYAKETGRAFYEIAPLKYSSWAECSEGFKMMSIGTKSVKFDISPDFQAHSNGTIAWATFTGTFNIELSDGKKQVSQARVTEILERDKTGWLVIHEHISMPMMQAPPAAPEKKKPAPKKKSHKR